jgi:hypothetical protein
MNPPAFRVATPKVVAAAAAATLAVAFALSFLTVARPVAAVGPQAVAVPPEQ